MCAMRCSWSAIRSLHLGRAEQSRADRPRRAFRCRCGSLAVVRLLHLFCSSSLLSRHPSALGRRQRRGRGRHNGGAAAGAETRAAGDFAGEQRRREAAGRSRLQSRRVVGRSVHEAIGSRHDTTSRAPVPDAVQDDSCQRGREQAHQWAIHRNRAIRRYGCYGPQGTVVVAAGGLHAAGVRINIARAVASLRVPVCVRLCCRLRRP